jgi:hypothetical protein
MSAGSGSLSSSLSSSLCWARALRGGLATATLRRQRGARVGRAAEVAEPVDSAWTRTPDSRSADNTKRADISAADAEMKVHRSNSSKGCGEFGTKTHFLSDAPPSDVGTRPATLFERCMRGFHFFSQTFLSK